MKYLDINLVKYVQDLYEENYKILVGKLKELLNKWRDIPCSWMGDSILSRCQFFPT